MNEIDNIIDFVKGWIEYIDSTEDKDSDGDTDSTENSKSNARLNDDQITEFVGQLQEQLVMMDYNLPERKLINYPCF